MLPTRLADPFVRNAVGQFQTTTAQPMPKRAITRFIVIHHAAWEYEGGDAVRSIFAYHSSKWPRYGRIGYHEVIQVEPDGSLRCYQVNPPDQWGAGVAEQNDVCYHICAATNFANDVPAQPWIDALARRAAAARQRYTSAQIVGHKEIAKPESPTACPGGKWTLWKPTLLAQAESLLAQQLPIGRYQIKRVPIYQRQDGTGPLAGYIEHGSAPVGVDKIYPSGMAHLSDGRGFVRLSLLEPVQ